MALDILNISQVANMLNLSERTLRRYDVSGKLVAFRHSSGALYYTREQIQDYLKGTYNKDDSEKYLNVEKSIVNIFVDYSRLDELLQIIPITDEEVSEKGGKEVKLIFEEGYKYYSINYSILDTTETALRVHNSTSFGKVFCELGSFSNDDLKFHAVLGWEQYSCKEK